jgi:DNA modification methylase
MLLQGDCLDLLSTLEAGSIDLTVTSPPYDNLRTYNGSLTDWTQAKWQAIIAELYRVTKQGGVVVWVVGDATINGSETGTSFRQALWAMECGFRLHDTMIYQKAGTGACGSNLSYLQNFEYMFVFAKGRPVSINRIADHQNKHAGAVKNLGRKGKNGEKKDTNRRVVPEFSVRANVWQYGSGGYSFGHPAKFPDNLARDHILSWSNEGDTVLDPFLGSGTTGKMAVQLNRKFIGIERDAEYFQIAQRRIEAATVQERMAV